MLTMIQSSRAVLSPRAVFFMPDRVYFSCRHCEWTEDTFSDLNPSEPSENTLESIFKFRGTSFNPIYFYHSLIGEITGRTLTRQEDTERAVAPLLRRASELMKCSFLNGIPTAGIDQHLLFQSEAATKRRRRNGFPSYSWTGWIGKSDHCPVDFSEEEDDWLANHTWIIW